MAGTPVAVGDTNSVSSGLRPADRARRLRELRLQWLEPNGGGCLAAPAFVLLATMTSPQTNTGEIAGPRPTRPWAPSFPAPPSPRSTPTSGAIVERVSDRDGCFYALAAYRVLWDITVSFPGARLRDTFDGLFSSASVEHVDLRVHAQPGRPRGDRSRSITAGAPLLQLANRRNQRRHRATAKSSQIPAQRPQLPRASRN